MHPSPSLQDEQARHRAEAIEATLHLEDLTLCLGRVENELESKRQQVWSNVGMYSRD